MEPPPWGAGLEPLEPEPEPPEPEPEPLEPDPLEPDPVVAGADVLLPPPEEAVLDSSPDRENANTATITARAIKPPINHPV